MATKRKKLSAAKAEAASVALETVLNGTEHDERLSTNDRYELEEAHTLLFTLTRRLRRDERTAR